MEKWTLLLTRQFFACYCSPPQGGGTGGRKLLRSSLTATLLVLLTCLQTYGQNLSNKGKSFWVGYGHHQFMEPNRGNSQEMVLYLSAEEPANVTVTIDGTTWTRSYSIPANTVIATDQIPKTGTFDARLYSVPPTFGGTGGEGLFIKKGIHIVSDVPIVAYAHIYGSASSGATMLMPEETWGYYYVSLNSQQDYDFDCFSWMFVVAKDNNTKVEITPSVPTRNGKLPGVPFTVTLNRGEIYQVIGASLGGSTGYEMTGTTVKSVANSNDTCFPIAVFSGSSRTAIACAGNFGSSGDNNIQQIFPSQAWGKRYLTAPTSTDNVAGSFMTNPYKVVVKDPTTIVKRNGVQLTGLQGNSYYEFESNTPDYLESDKPILVAQYMASTGACPNTGGDGDPEMIYLSPVEQSIKRIGFYRNNRESIRVNYLTMIIPTKGTESLTIDGQRNAWTVAVPHPNRPGYSVVIKRWNSSQAQAIVQSDSAFTAVTYGLGSVESYGYNAGTLINNLNVIGVIHNEKDTSSYKNEFTCTQTPVELSVLLAYKPTEMQWNISKLGNMITPNADVSLTNPQPTGEELVNGVPYYKYTLPGTYVFSTIGTYEIPITNTHPSIEKCDHKEEVKITVDVKRKPTASFKIDFTGCTMDTVYFKGDSSGNGYNIDRWKWVFPGAVQDSGALVKRRFPVGQQNIQLSVISKEGCLADTMIPITVVAKPVADFNTVPAALCEGGGVSLTDQSTYGGTTPVKNWYWNFGNDTTASLDKATAQTAHYPKYGTYTVSHVVKVSELCVSDTVKKQVQVNAKPVLGFTYPQNCLEVDGLVQFNSTTTVPDGQAISTYAWNFGDANATPANPNTSAVADPQHNYTSFGTYNIKYTVTTAQGCTKDTTVSATFNLKPRLAFTALPAVCVNDKRVISVAKGSVTNGVTGTGTYKGPGVSSTGVFNPLTAGAGTHTVWYVFSTQSGCTDSISATITVHPKPQPAFTANESICLGEAVNFADQSTVATGNITTWKWIFGDGNNETRTDNTPFSRTYTAWDTYNVKLVTVSNNGCISDTAAKTIAVHAMPVPDFGLPTSICMPDGTARFTNTSAVPDNAALTYQWAFGDGGVSTAAAPVYNYKKGGTYTVSLTATSVYGCTVTKEKILDAFFNQPQADFSVAPDTLCQGADNVFTDKSRDDNNNIVSWAWTFGDGSGSTDRNPVKRYSQPGNYPVQLVVANGAGCVSQPFTSNVVVYLQPVIDAGQSFIVPQGTVLTFNATANDSTVLKFRWSPPLGLSDPTALRPTLAAMEDQVYTLTAIGEGSCSAMDELSVKVFKAVKVPNAFSPNGDQVNDRWELTNLSEYADCTVEVFNRYGQRVYYSEGYKTPWDGSYKGHLLPAATYYYIIKLKNGFAPLTGYVVILF
ncbi:PKD domain-containing protein [Chitinophaga filiformis]|uniref:PKD domain-containing protein n=1 Tax=Chitinophaga filiformis TaxID=104663 RepID=A0ABY4I6R0_CHIFI|nr:PKD domain-containing protein [Chitinophaga filiformis]UPK71781.1 PKD domain-containing protein [Chitinophaga filiformis]